MTLPRLADLRPMSARDFRPDPEQGPSRAGLVRLREDQARALANLDAPSEGDLHRVSRAAIVLAAVALFASFVMALWGEPIGAAVWRWTGGRP